MENKNFLEQIEFYTEMRDGVIETISKDVCAPCNAPQKKNVEINYANPLKCECRCKPIEQLLAAAKILDDDLKILLNKFQSI